MSHSKRNTSRPVFTAHERAIAKAAWASSSAKLSRESFLPFASCSLCLEPCRDPVSCTHGDLFCRECALSNILAQKKEIKRLEKLREQEAREMAEEQDRMDAQAKEWAVKQFELTQQGLDAKEIVGKDALSKEMLWKKKGDEEERVRKEEAEAGTGEAALVVAKRGEKRKFELDDEELLRITQEDRVKALKALDNEKASKPKLPSFWVPTITPSSNTKDVLHEVKKKLKSSPTCPASLGSKPHTYSLHTLISVQFTEEETKGSDEKQRICPACRKALTNASKAVMAKPCGHVLCKSCVTKFMIPSNKPDPHNPDEDLNVVRCYVCNEDVSERRAKKDKEHHKAKDKIRPGLVDLRAEGTGFSAGGANTVHRSGVAFQC